jgi:hypothetical protein
MRHSIQDRTQPRSAKVGSKSVRSNRLGKRAPDWSGADRAVGGDPLDGLYLRCRARGPVPPLGMAARARNQSRREGAGRQGCARVDVAVKSDCYAVNTS